jgi:CMD domain protein
MSQQPDVVDELVGIAPGSPLDAIRRARPQQREHSQVAHDALLDPLPSSAAHVSSQERAAVAVYVAALHAAPALVERYGAGLEPDLRAAVLALASRTAVPGPYGEYDAATLEHESVDGLVARALPGERERLGERLAAALEHAHLLVLRPRESGADDLQRLLDAGWDTTGVVTLSQLVSYLAYQVRLVHGLGVLVAAGRAA